MGVLADLASGATGGIFSGIGSLLKDARVAITGVDPEKAAEIEALLQQIELQMMTAQTAINLEEAKSESWWVNGWRPYIGWGCGSSLIYSSILRPIMVDVAQMCGYVGTFPTLDTTITTQILLALLGVGVMRSYDKKQAPSPKGKE